MKDGAELVVSETPVVGDAVAAKEAIAGTNIYREELSGLERVAATASLIPGGKLATKAGEGLGAAAKALGNLFGLGGGRLTSWPTRVSSSAKLLLR